jgi:hypothetical protein
MAKPSTVLGALEPRASATLAVGRIVETPRLHGDHLATGAAHRFNGRPSGLDGHVATDDRRALSSEPKGSRTAHAAVRAGDEAHPS